MSKRKNSHPKVEVKFKTGLSSLSLSLQISYTRGLKKYIKILKTNKIALFKNGGLIFFCLIKTFSIKTFHISP